MKLDDHLLGTSLTGPLIMAENLVFYADRSVAPSVLGFLQSNLSNSSYLTILQFQRDLESDLAFGWVCSISNIWMFASKSCASCVCWWSLTPSRGVNGLIYSTWIQLSYSYVINHQTCWHLILRLFTIYKFWLSSQLASAVGVCSVLKFNSNRNYSKLRVPTIQQSVHPSMVIPWMKVKPHENDCYYTPKRKTTLTTTSGYPPPAINNHPLLVISIKKNVPSSRACAYTAWRQTRSLTNLWNSDFHVWIREFHLLSQKTHKI